MIEEYHFGSIRISGKTYNYDVEVRWTGEVLKWWRKESHLIDKEDVERAVEQNPDTIIIGTGESGLARVTEEAQKAIKSKGIELIIDITGEATKTFNIIQGESEEEDSNPPTARGAQRSWEGGGRVGVPLKRAPGRQRKVIGLFHLTC